MLYETYSPENWNENSAMGNHSLWIFFSVNSLGFQINDITFMINVWYIKALTTTNSGLTVERDIWNIFIIYTKWGA